MVNKRSLNKLALLVKSCGVEFLSVKTLTYGQNFPMSGREAKADLNHYLTVSKRVFGPYEYVWCLEFQERGAVHFHLATTLKPPTKQQLHDFAVIWGRISIPGDWWYCDPFFDLPKPVESQGMSAVAAGYSVHSHPRSWEALRKHDGVGRYFAKYANKLRQKKVPTWYSDVGRFWGASRGVKMPEGKAYFGGEADVRQVLAVHGRNVQSWHVLPKVVLI